MKSVWTADSQSVKQNKYKQTDMKSKLAIAALIAPLFAIARSAEDATGGGGGAALAPDAWMKEEGMTPIEIRISGVAGIKYAQPATVEKYDALAKVQGRCLADACSKQLFHGTYGDIRAGITEKLIKDGYGTPKMWIGKVEVQETLDNNKKVTGYVSVDGKKTFKPDSDVKYEADKAFFDRICSERGVEAASFTSLIQEVANSCPFDPSRKERSSSPRKIAKAYLEAAQGIIDAGNEAINGAAAQLSELLDKPLDVSDKETRLTVLATAISEAELKEKRENEAKLKNKYLSKVG